MQKLITKKLAATAPALYATDGQGTEATAHAHFFSCFNGYDWYMTELDQDTGEAFGLVKGQETELGYFSIAEFERLNRANGFEVVERDAYFKPCKLSALID